MNENFDLHAGTHGSILPEVENNTMNLFIINIKKLMINVNNILTKIKYTTILNMCSTSIFDIRRDIHEYRYGKNSKEQ